MRLCASLAVAYWLKEIDRGEAMKIVNRKTFTSLPANTLYSKYEPCFFGDLEIKGDTLDHCNDYCVQRISDAIKCSGSEEFGNLLDDAERGGGSLAMDFDCESRDGLFEDDQLFAVWEKRDVIALIDRLKEVVDA
jgi:hypothetical protein